MQHIIWLVVFFYIGKGPVLLNYELYTIDLIWIRVSGVFVAISSFLCVAPQSLGVARDGERRWSLSLPFVRRIRRH